MSAEPIKSAQEATAAAAFRGDDHRNGGPHSKVATRPKTAHPWLGYTWTRLVFPLLAVAAATQLRAAVTPYIGFQLLIVYPAAILLAAGFGSLMGGVVATAAATAVICYSFDLHPLSTSAPSDTVLLTFFVAEGLLISWVAHSLRKSRDERARLLGREKAAVVEARLGEDRYRTLVESAAAVVWNTDADGAFVTPQPSWQAFTGQSWAEYVGRGWLTAIHPDDREKFRELWAGALAARRPFEAEGRLWHGPSKRYRHIDARAAAVVHSDGSVREWIGTCADVTDEKLAQEALRESEQRFRTLSESLEHHVAERTAQLQDANRELESFAYTVSHDLRAPLRHMNSLAELLLKRAGDQLDPDALRYARTIAEAGRHAGHMIDDLLAFSRMGRSEMRRVSVDAGQLVREVLEHLGPEVTGRKIVWDIGPLPDIEGDVPMLRLVFQNLILNAVKYTRPRDEARIWISARQEDESTVFCVRDNGVGFDMRYVDKLFGVFQRLHSDQEFEGNGIGLAHVRRIVQRHGGRTWAESAVGEGAAFFFSLPAAKGTPT